MNKESTIRDKENKKRRGFTLVELIVSISIFAMMTTLIVAKYGNFNQSVLLTNLAYDIALTIRTAQTYGVSVRQEGGDFNYAYGVYFSAATGENTKFIFFADRILGSSGYYVTGEEINTYTLKRGAKISEICMGTNSTTCTSELELNLTFKRPDPGAIICHISCDSTLPTYVRITIQGTDLSTRSVVVRSNGQISVGED